MTARAIESFQQMAQTFRRSPEERARWLTLRCRKTLYPHQEAAVADILANERTPRHGGAKGSLLCEKTGTGKSLVVIASIHADAQERVRSSRQCATTPGTPTDCDRFRHPTLLVTPKHLLGQWRRMFADELPPGALAVEVLRSSRQILGADVALIDFAVDVVVTTYEALKAAARRLRHAATAGSAQGLFRVRWHRLVLEEASLVINDDTDNFAAVQSIDAERRLLVTATPSPNARWREVRALLVCLGVDDGYIRRTVLAGSAASACGATGEEEDDDDEQVIAAQLAQAARMLEPFRVNKVPFARVEIAHRWVTWATPAERAYYEAVEEQLRSLPGVNKLACETTLQYLCLSPVVMLPPADVRTLPEDRPCFSKMRAVIEYARRELPADEKGLVFAHSKRGLYELAHHLRRAGVACLMLTGDTRDDADRQTVLRQFCDPAHPSRLLLCTHKKVGMGTDGLQRVANHVLLFDLSYVPSDDVQAHGRVAREGQTRPTFLIKFVLVGTVEERRLAVNRDKASRLAVMFPAAPRE